MKVRTLSDQLPTAPLIERFQGGLRANADPRMLAERLLRGSELALEAARRDAADAMLACEELSERILALEAELGQARQEPERLQGLLATERRSRRLAEQQAHAERARREELQLELASEREDDQTDPPPDDRAEAEARRRELESEAQALRRQVDELGHLAGSARRARERAERRVAELSAALERAGGPVLAPQRPGLAPTVSDGLVREFALAGRPVVPNPPPRPGLLPREPDPQLALERHLVLARAGAVTAASPAATADPAPAELRTELATLRSGAERETAARLRVEARAVQLERELSEQISRSSRAYDAIEELRKRLGAIGGWSAVPPPEPQPALADQPEAAAAEPEASVAEPEGEASAAEPQASVAEPQASAADPESDAAGPAVLVEPERFNAALTRLREAASAEAQAPDPGASPGPAVPSGESSAGTPAAWLPDVFRRLAREDPSAAGQLVLELLPAQLKVHPEPIAYDLELPGETCIRLTVTDGELRLELGQPRPASEVSFTVTGDPAGLARLLVAGRIGRRLRRGLPKVTGERRGLQALDGLVRAHLSLRQLDEAGVRLEPRLALEVVARMIDPSWTAGSRFAIGYRSPGGEPVAYLEVGDGRPATVSEAAAPDLVAGMIACAPESLLAVLDGAERDVTEFDGERAQLAKLMSWVKRAQSG